jgi:putative glutamine amidotransferase
MRENTALMRPLIGVTTSELRPAHVTAPRRHSEPKLPEMALGMTYLRAIELAGGLPVVLPPVALEAVEELLDRLDGLCLSGGPDLDPDTYGARERHVELGETEPTIDAFELALAHAADARGLPLLGVCRGAQALNVARGGTLHQHVPGHRQVATASRPTHPVAIERGSRIARVARRSRLRVNSFHHQAVDAPGAGLRVVAHAPDGTVEAVEDRAAAFVLGVQWHAEALAERRAHLALFGGLVEAADARSYAPARASKASRAA